MFSLIKSFSLTQEVLYFVVFMAAFCDGISDACNTACHEAPGISDVLVEYLSYLSVISILLIVLMFYIQGKSRKYLRFLRATGPLTAVALGTTFVKIFHPSSISLVRIT